MNNSSTIKSIWRVGLFGGTCIEMYINLLNLHILNKYII